MLILTRNVGKALIMGENMNIEVKVLGVKGSQVKLGISAPKEIPVHREEIAQIIFENDPILAQEKIY